MGNYVPPGYNEGRPHSMMYVYKADLGWSLEHALPPEEERLYQTLEQALPSTFVSVDRWVNGSDGMYYVFAESDKCEVVLSDEHDYVAVVFLAKQNAKGKYCQGWSRTAKKVYKVLHEANFDLGVRTGEYQTLIWNPGIDDEYVRQLCRNYAARGVISQEGA